YHPKTTDIGHNNEKHDFIFTDKARKSIEDWKISQESKKDQFNESENEKQVISIPNFSKEIQKSQVTGDQKYIVEIGEDVLKTLVYARIQVNQNNLGEAYQILYQGLNSALISLQKSPIGQEYYHELEPRFEKVKSLEGKDEFVFREFLNDLEDYIITI
ncbi:MAG: hypothetical protein ACTSWL_09275, partial [Promethearchaeota archaeon]